MRSRMIAFSLGILLAGYIPWLPSSAFVNLFLVIPLLSFRFTTLGLLGAYSFGIFYCLVWAQLGINRLLPKSLESEDIWVRGEVLSLPRYTERSQRFEFMSDSKQKLLLNLYDDLTIEPNQRWQFKVRLKRPHGFANPGGFDYEGWLTQHGINATGYIRSDPNNRLLNGQVNWFSFSHLRFSLRTKIEQLGLSNLSLIKALSIGDRDTISEDEWALFTHTGTNHLIVISGLHVGLVAFMVYRLSIVLISFITPLLLVIPAPRMAAFIALAAAYFYAGLAGFSLPALRAFIMVAVFMLGQCLVRKTAALNTYCLALAVVLAFEPLAPQSSGFWLSFGAVGILLMFSRIHTTLTPSTGTLLKQNLWQKFLMLLKGQAFLFVGLFPLMLIFFQQVSLLAPLINLIAIPFVSFVIVPLCLLGLVALTWLPSLATGLFALADYSIMGFKQALMLVMHYSDSALIQLPKLNWLSLLILVLGLGFLLLTLSRKVKYKLLKVYSITICLLLSLYDFFSLKEGGFKLDVLDVGQGLAVVISTANHHLVYDAGPAYSPRFNAGSGVVQPFLMSQNISTIDTVIISHGDNDHAGGLAALIKAYPTARYLGSDIDVLKAAITTEPCLKGQRWRWDGVDFEILHPQQQSYSKNNGSCVLKVSAGEYSVLLTGDIERKVERTLLREQKAKLQANLLIAPHHGSLTSSTIPFIKAVAPQTVIFSTGYLNRFKHPHPKVQARYTDSAIETLNTPDTGAISFLISSQEGVSSPKPYRQSRQRYWSSLK